MDVIERRTLCAWTALALLAAAPSQASNFPDFGYQPPASEYSGPLFELSQDYPKVRPTKIPEFFKLLPPLTNDFEKWRPYVDAVEQYCLEGNVKNNWDVQKNTVRRWYHMPWQHYGPLGREGIHGLTKEAQIQVQQLASTQVTTGQTFAVGIYNDIGAYTIGQVWQNPQSPDLSYTSQPNSFNNGTVVCKPLFADVVLKEVPFLVNPVLWQAYVTDTFSSSNRLVKNVALIQMDFAVRDTRVPGTGWIFGTFQYNGATGKKASWNNLVPVGVMFGNDPEDTGNEFTNKQPTVTKINPNLQQTAINTRPELPPTHLGWNGRLDGPVDNPVSACMSCHMTAEAPQLSPMNPTFQAPDKVPPVGSPEWMRWFQNEPAGVPFDAQAQSTDYSLQLAGGVANFYDWKCLEGGIYVDGGNACEQATQLRGQMRTKAARVKRVFKVQRDQPTPPSSAPSGTGRDAGH